MRWKVFLELEDVSDSCASEPIKALVIVTDNANIVTVSCEAENQTLLDVVRILVLVDHQVAKLLVVLASYLWTLFEHPQGFNLDPGEIQHVVVVDEVLVCLPDLGEDFGFR